MNQVASAPGRGPASTHNTPHPGGLIPTEITNPSPAGPPAAHHPTPAHTHRRRGGKHRRPAGKTAPGQVSSREAVCGDRDAPVAWPEKLDLEAQAGGARFRLAAETGTGSQLSIAISVFLLVAASCVMMGAVFLFGTSSLIASLAIVAGFYLLVRFIAQRPAPRKKGEGESHS